MSGWVGECVCVCVLTIYIYTTQFTCFNSTKIQIVEEERQRRRRGGGGAAQGAAGTPQFTLLVHKYKY